MSQRIEGEKIHIKMPAELLKKVDIACRKTGLNRSQMIRNFADIGADIFSIYNAVGIFDVYEIITKTKKKIAGDVSPGLFEEA